MNYDVIVIGGGMAGYTSAIHCLEKGLKTALVNNGRSALHFSSGSVDLLSSTPSGTPVRFPYPAIANFSTEYPEHPYAKLGQEKISKAVDWFTEMMNRAGVLLKQKENNENHQRVTTLGTLKSTFLSQQFVEQIGFNYAQNRFDRVVLLAIEQYRDFQTKMVADNLVATPLFKNTPIVSLPISMLENSGSTSSINNFRSTDFAKILSSEAAFNHFANQIMAGASSRDLVIVPSIFGTTDGVVFLQKLKEYTGLRFHEVPTMPPSLMGIRIEEALESEFIRLGGVQLKGDKVTSGQFSSSEKGVILEKIWTKNLRDYTLTANAFILASGSFFSNGLRAEHNRIIEPVFGLDVCTTGARSDWHSEAFSHQTLIHSSLLALKQMIVFNLY
ncbi:glycerol-3-phosphate dehydrogenase subunit GlpB [Vibrio algarum]|uniref:Glycerol-3-phosphate dehydrogenase subunit GlpB n=1 Tax=Vibrio algarum TaxID=3020714 RepID=A0ABT4YRW2_9VIBR|nr:glycerol-3-phosphate dehydrogenase subunit GlpB [Vibrio sp. KJ40-1]MDB1124299.1 glycerol-3-phosphate dehydrogenase subunit GlpB [Vibrio sp. KJ40-1]